MGKTVSGEQSTEQPTVETPEPKRSAEPEVVQLDKKEHARLQAELRRAQKSLKEKEEAEAEARRKAEQEAAAARGDFESALETERTERQRLKDALVERDKRDAVRDAISAAELTGSRASLVRRLVDLGKVTEADGTYDATDAVKEITEDYADLFGGSKEDPDTDTTGEEQRPQRVRRGASPPSAQQSPFEGYISPEEYSQTPSTVRKTSVEFQERVKRSRPYWPKEFSATSLPKSQ